jgi:predicted nucleic acid-binding Zn ribbon protein
MASKGKTNKPAKMDRNQRRTRTLQILFFILTVIILLSMLLSLVVKF